MTYYCKEHEKTCRYAFDGKCYRPDKSYADDFKDRTRKEVKK